MVQGQGRPYFFFNFPVEVKQSSGHDLPNAGTRAFASYHHFRTNSPNDGLSFEQENVAKKPVDVELCSKQILFEFQKFEQKFGRGGANETLRMSEVVHREVEKQIDGNLFETQSNNFGRKSDEAVKNLPVAWKN